MSRNRLSFATFVLFTALPLLAACHTTAGVGEDVSATGHTVTKAANQATP